MSGQVRSGIGVLVVVGCLCLGLGVVGTRLCLFLVGCDVGACGRRSIFRDEIVVEVGTRDRQDAVPYRIVSVRSSPPPPPPLI